MQDRVKYEYAIIRVVPKVERGEFFNVGVILFSKSRKFLGVKYLIDQKKLEAFSSELDLNDLNDYLGAWKLVCDGAPSSGVIGKMELTDRFRWLAASRSTMIQTSQTHTGLCHDPEKELEAIFKNHVL
ncbi:hypothetical protein KCTC52924_02983 [Arenibacter antarcticus]|uniref:DUF3037 domain-containing protein n=1 Tax=Arenibacter antarcticus TaxID=2040469 RepID=A0ABW5VGR6_9FLAO|nr:DUF3037 domain-containing protein [Arenibacter sp. H213]MCM4166072.1 DUF3037 domain-containing protein [Arenibacter sp. H213]